MTKFFDDLLFVEKGVYTLWGSKPITEIYLYHYTDEEMKEFENEWTDEDLKNCYIQDQYDIPENWERWEKIQSRFPMPKHLLFHSHFSEDGKVAFVYFVNVMKTAAVIQSHYSLFRQEVGFDFHPLEVVLEMPNQDSRFWQKVRSSDRGALIWGLLFGYGEENAYGFHWKYFDCPELCEKFLHASPPRFSNPPPKGQVHLSLKTLEIPDFATFSDEDEVIERYAKEREHIKKVYRGKDHLAVTLEKLCCSGP